MRALIALLAGLAAGVLGYGWWHASTHATFYLHLAEHGDPQFGAVRGAQLEFLDAAGKPLARGKTDDKVGVAWVYHPAAGYCGPDLDQPAYRRCFDTHAPWLFTWVPQVRAVSIVAGRCRLERVPLEFSADRDAAWTWWVPLPHVGGTPYTHYSGSLVVDTKNCTVARFRG